MSDSVPEHLRDGDQENGGAAVMPSQRPSSPELFYAVRKLTSLITVDHIKPHTDGCASAGGDVCDCNAREVRELVATLNGGSAGGAA